MNAVVHVWLRPRDLNLRPPSDTGAVLACLQSEREERFGTGYWIAPVCCSRNVPRPRRARLQLPVLVDTQWTAGMNPPNGQTTRDSKAFLVFLGEFNSRRLHPVLSTFLTSFVALAAHVPRMCRGHRGA